MNALLPADVAQAAAVDLPATLLWAAIILAAVLAYATLDGFDLGVGMLLPGVRDARARHGMTHTIAPFWDGNETWLVLAGAGLLAGFPVVYANVLGTLPVPLSLLLVGLVLRGAGLEFSHAAPARHAGAWDLVFAAGSWVASFCIGLSGGLLLQLAPLRGQAPDWWSPLPWLAGLGMCWFHALLGATWLALKADGRLAQQMREKARVLLVAMPGWPLVLMLAADPGTRPPAWLACAIWGFAIVVARRLRRRLEAGTDSRSFVELVLATAAAFGGWAAALVGALDRSADLGWRHLAAPASSMDFTLYGALLLIPLIIGYSAWGYHVFRGRLAGDRRGTAVIPRWLRQLGWLVVLWLASVLGLGLVAAALRCVLPH